MTPVTSLIDKAALAAFRERGFVVIPGVLDDRQLALARQTVAAMLFAEPPPAGHRGSYFLWPRFAAPRFDGAGGVRARSRPAALLPGERHRRARGQPAAPRPTAAGADICPARPHRSAVAAPARRAARRRHQPAVARWHARDILPARRRLADRPRRAGPREPVGLAGHAPAVRRIPGRARRRRASRLHPEPYPPIALGEPEQVSGPRAASVRALPARAQHRRADGPAGAPMRQVVYFRLEAAGHRGRWREAVTDPLAEFRAV